MPAKIMTFEDRFGARTLIEHALRNPSSSGELAIPSLTVAAGPTVAAHVNHSRWIVDCPTAGCTGAEMVSFNRPTFFCSECRNAEFGHQPLPVSTPDDRQRRQVEAYLSARPVPATRNWRPDESVKQLRDENREHGIRLTTD